MSMVFRKSWEQHAIQAALKSTCAKSKRGVVIFSGDGGPDYDGALVGRGWNGPPHPFQCGKTDVCRAVCNKVAVHAEEMALLQAGSLAVYSSLVHIKVVDGEAVPSGSPSCWQCSRAILQAGIHMVWLKHKEGWKGYHAVRFHQLTLMNCDLPTYRFDRCDECGGRKGIDGDWSSEHSVGCSLLPY